MVAARLARRYGSDRAEALRWHLQRHAALSRRLAESDRDEAMIATDRLGPSEVARQVLSHFGLDSPAGA